MNRRTFLKSGAFSFLFRLIPKWAKPKIKEASLPVFDGEEGFYFPIYFPQHKPYLHSRKNYKIFFPFIGGDN